MLEKETQNRSQKHPNISYGYAIISNLSLVIMQISMKIASSQIKPIYILTIRGIILCMANFLIILLNNQTMKIKSKRGWKIIMIRNFLSPLSVLFTLAPLKYISAGTIESLFNTQAIIIVFVQALYYKKSINCKHLFLTVICFIGVLLIIQPPFLFGLISENQSSQQSENKLYFLIVLTGALTYCIAMICLSQLKQEMSKLSIMQHFYTSQVIMFGTMSFVEQQQPNLFEKFLLIQFFIALCGLILSAYIYQYMITLAVHLKKPSQITPFGYVAVIFATISDILLFNYNFSILTFLGIGLTSIGLLSQTFIKQDQKKKIYFQQKQQKQIKNSKQNESQNQNTIYKQYINSDQVSIKDY